MSDSKKPRICEVLGVEVGEKWTVDGSAHDATYRISMSGNLQRKGVDGRWRPTNESTVDLVAAIDYPERIRRLPCWTKKDVEDAKAIRRLWPDALSIEREQTGEHYRVLNFRVRFGDRSQMNMAADDSFLPGLELGETVSLDEILEAENDV